MESKERQMSRIGATMLNPQMKDWMTGRAFDIAQIAVVFGGYDAAELVKRAAYAPTHGEKTNAATICRILDEMLVESKS